MKILTININKGGTGKTTVTHNFAEFLSQQHRVLLLDFDESANLTKRYGYYNELENTILAIFEEQEIQPIKLSDNLDLIAGHREIEHLKERLLSKRRREILLGKWIAKNLSWLENSYDYVLIDTENDEGILTTNAVIVSDMVLGVANPSKDGVEALPALRKFVSELNDDFDSETKVYFLANLVKYSEKYNFSETSSKEMLTALQNRKEYVGYIQRHPLLANQETIFRQAHLSKSLKVQKVLDEINPIFELIKARLDEGEVYE